MPETPTLSIRPARPGDLAEVSRLCAAHAAYEQADFDPAGHRERLGSLLFGAGARLTCVVAAREVGLAGYATWSQEVSTWDAWLYAHMDCLYLDPDARGGGVGRRLVAHVVRGAVRAGCQAVQWQTPSFNTRAMAFYDRLGATRKDKARFALDAATMRALAAGGRADGSVT